MLYDILLFYKIWHYTIIYKELYNIIYNIKEYYICYYKTIINNVILHASNHYTT